MTDFPKELLEITEFLANQTELPIKGSGQDKRRESAEVEEKIIKLLENQNRWIISNPNSQRNTNTSWYDLSVITENSKNLFIRIKISSLKSVDNTGCMGGIYYVLTGKTPPSDTTNIIRKLNRDLHNNENNYYFLIIKKPNKENKKLPKSFVCSLRTLKEIKPSGDNLPFQCNWGRNTEPSSYRNHEKLCNFLLKNYGRSLKLRANRYDDFKKFFPNMVAEEVRSANAELDI